MIEKNQFRGHEQLAYFNDEETGLKAFIAVHNTTLGPGAGGCRMWPYECEMDALNDALRLSRGMSYKNAMAGLPLGGGKAVIIANSKTDKSEELFKAFGRCVQKMGGKYITAEDVGMTTEDMMVIASETDYIAGLPHGDHASGDPSPFTARGVYNGIRAAVKYKLGKDSLEGLTVAVQGVGHVGLFLCELLHNDGAKIIVSDIVQEHLDEAVEKYGVTVVAPDEILSVECDVLSPCALGAVLNDDTIPNLKTTIVAGGANNQLANDSHGVRLMDRGVLYAPDYVINAGGIINVSGETSGNYDLDSINEKVDNIYDTLIHIFERSDEEKRPTNVVADEMAEEIIAKAKAKK
ncbi:Glu/Leu/Phe/Val dehydrogenase dimerization domain-containing protein [Pseudemcibacter aquimaris]|uniref:Glu/Leu/Phe/Val dehydrogenase dimerization domain-containing protein n=1 Tax=Pseudemcibacter aquimaris TaxID=2857064 RepID=UPI002012F606|nr:Glu/Leu/Phe/Val dehydrogenase dimerization domain-containing protein [Pseudemcibacter aquimaris]MCC3860516.1 leucine dehydrogenase [Pseudemcibacter aquimaris]WDU59341.1 leucine dehydrogenase [Pseudemcibacter aquimaris]